MTRPTPAAGAQHCSTCGAVLPYRRPSKRDATPYCSRACHNAGMAQRARTGRLWAAVQAFLAEGVPMTHSAGYGLACAFCGVGTSVLAVAGHAADCRWRRLKAAVGESA